MLRIALAALLVLLPSATAQAAPEPVARVEFASPHGDGHVMDIPRESRRARMEFTVKVHTTDFYCPTGGRAVVNLVLDYPNLWAGSSFDPAAVSVVFANLEPGLGPQKREATTTLDLFWGEEAPATGARNDYTIDSQTTFEGSCAPAPRIIEDRYVMSAAMPDVEPEAGPGAPACADLELPECAPPPVLEPEASVPSPAGLLVLAPLALGLAASRRRAKRSRGHGRVR